MLKEKKLISVAGVEPFLWASGTGPATGPAHIVIEGDTQKRWPPLGLINRKTKRDSKQINTDISTLGLVSGKGKHNSKHIRANIFKEGTLGWR